MTTTVNDIEHMKSQSMYGVGVIKIFLHQGANVAEAQAQVTALVQTLLRILPQGMSSLFASREGWRPASCQALRPAVRAGRRRLTLIT